MANGAARVRPVGLSTRVTTCAFSRNLAPQPTRSGTPASEPRGAASCVGDERRTTQVRSASTSIPLLAFPPVPAIRQARLIGPAAARRPTPGGNLALSLYEVNECFLLIGTTEHCSAGIAADYRHLTVCTTALPNISIRAVLCGALSSPPRATLYSVCSLHSNGGLILNGGIPP